MAAKPTYKELELRINTLEQEAVLGRQREKALRDSEHKLNTHLKSTPIGAISWDLDFRVIEWNPSAETIFGYSDREAKGKHATELILPEELKEEVDVIFQDLISEKGGARSTNQNLTKDGKRVLCDWYNTTLKDTDGKVSGVASLVQDITYQKQAEEELQASEKEYRSTINGLLVGVVVHASDTSILLSNPEASNILGLTYEQMSGKKAIDPSWHFVHEDLTIMKVENYPVSRVFSTEKPLSDYVIGINRPDKNHITWVIVNATPVFSKDKSLDKVIVNFADITALKRMEEVLAKRIVALTIPLDDADDVDFETLFNLNEIQRIQDEFSSATGVASIITQVDGTPITKPSNFSRLCSDIIRKTDKGLANCFKSDAAIGCLSREGPVIQPCLSGGLWDAGAGISVGGRHIANWLIGQVRDETQTADKMRAYARDIGADEQAIVEAFNEVSAMSREQFGLVAQLLFTIANQLSSTAYQNVQQARFITKLKHAEESLKVSNERYYQVTTNLPGLVYQFAVHVDGSYSMPYISDGVKSMFGVSSVEVNQDINSLLQFIHPDDVSGFELSMIKSANSLSPYNHEFRTLINGDVVWVDALSRPKQLSNGDIIWDGILLDITERKKTEDEKKKLEERLLQAQKMEAIGTLAGGIAHDFNNILSAILGYSEMAREDSPSGSPVADDLDKVLSAGNRAKGLVQQILAFSRQDDAECIPLLPASIVKESIKMLRPSLPTTIEFNQNIDSNTGLIFADPTHIHQILMNLCTNAFHAMEETGGRIDISLKETDLSLEDLVHEPSVEAGAFIQLSICDSGPGIPPEIKDKIFEPYFTTKDTGKGTGMGLSIVHGIVQSCGGFITSYSELGEGTAFHVFLPIFRQKDLPGTQAAEPLPIGRERILFVDDEEILAEMGKDILERLGYHVTVRSNSLQALETFQNQPDQFDIIITDQTMPGMTGADLSRRILQIRPNIPIILCTGYSTIMSKEKAKSIGIKEFVLKPLAKRDIANLVRKVLDNNQA